MPELQFKGKEFVYNHHLTAPFRPLEMHADQGIVLFSEIDARLPALIRDESVGEIAGEAE